MEQKKNKRTIDNADESERKHVRMKQTAGVERRPASRCSFSMQCLDNIAHLIHCGPHTLRYCAEGGWHVGERKNSPVTLTTLWLGAGGARKKGR